MGTHNVRRILWLLGMVMVVGVAHAETIKISNTRGEYGEIKTNGEMALEHIFYMGKTKDVENAKKTVLKDPSKYNPFLLMAMGDRMVRDGDIENGLFWFHAGRIRMAYDAALCTDTSVMQTVVVASMKMRDVLEAGLRNTEMLKTILPKAIEWEKNTPYNYDHRWISFSGIKNYSSYFNKDEKIAPLLKPEDEWKKIHADVVDKYMKNMSKTIGDIEKAGGFEQYKQSIQNR